mmetsp:Transcript_33494/g.95291  ORF Transcript_33494/g.95291 Transcript_33494/m.95291 type:complete len:216 (-) Transcript_33494:335-982(-)
MTPELYMCHSWLAPTDTTTGPEVYNASSSGSALFCGRVLQPTRPNFAPPPPSTVTEPSAPLCVFARSPRRSAKKEAGEICISEGQLCSLPRYSHSSSGTRPCLAAYCMANSAVAPWQPPVPPHCRGFGVQSTICWAENLRSDWYSSAWARNAVAEETAQQLPHGPWFATSCMALSLVCHVKSEGSVAKSNSRDDTAARPKLEAVAEPASARAPLL